MNVLELLNQGSRHLKEKKITSHRLDSEILLSKVLNKRREDVLINLSQKIYSNQILRYNKLLNRRSQKEPVAYILQEKEFWSKPFFVNKNTLIPRPETELMVEKLIKIYKNKSISILDIGTGSGCILISLISELVYSSGVGIDICNNAIQIAKKNLKRQKKTLNIKFLNKSLSSNFKEKFDLIVSNPPYIKSKDIKNLDDDVKKYEPRLALDGGNDGLDLIKKIIYKTRHILKKEGLLALEIGNEQCKKVSKILLKNNFKIEYTIKDYRNNIRCLISTYMDSYNEQ
jgi:release factor glutamine methyltransferase